MQEMKLSTTQKYWNLIFVNATSYISVKSNITVAATIAAQVAFKNCALLITFITKIDRRKMGDADALDLFILIYNLFEYTLNYCDPTGSLWFYSKDEF